jgi:hypothetical protein
MSWMMKFHEVDNRACEVTARFSAKHLIRLKKLCGCGGVCYQKYLLLDTDRYFRQALRQSTLEIEGRLIKSDGKTEARASLILPVLQSTSSPLCH